MKIFFNFAISMQHWRYNYRLTNKECFTKKQLPMNESYSTKNSLKNTYVSLDSLTDLLSEVSEMEADLFGAVDKLNLSPSQDVMNKIYSYL